MSSPNAEKVPSERPVIGKFKIKREKEENFVSHPLNREFPGIHRLMPKTKQVHVARQQPVYQKPKNEAEILTLANGEILKIDLDRGVKWSKAKEMWCAKTMFEGKKWTLGYFPDKKDANKAYMGAIRAKQENLIKEHLERIGARITVGSRGPSKRPKREFEFYADTPVLAKELAFRPNQARPAYSLGGVTHKKRRGRPKKFLKTQTWRPIRPRPGHNRARSWSPYNPTMAHSARSPSRVKSEPPSPIKLEPEDRLSLPDASPGQTSSMPVQNHSSIKVKQEPRDSNELQDIANILVGMKRSG